MNGWKTIAGIAGTVGTVIATGGASDLGQKVAEIAVNADMVVTGMFTMLTLVGLIHKGEKRAR